MKLGLYDENGLYVPFYTDRKFHHTFIISKPRNGKTTVLTPLALDDIHSYKPVVVLGNTILQHIPEEGQSDIMLFADREYTFGFNILERVIEEGRALFATTFLDP